jgi:thymidylate synthase
MDFPTLSIQNPQNLKEIDDFLFDSFIIENYNSHPVIKGEMAI